MQALDSRSGLVVVVVEKEQSEKTQQKQYKIEPNKQN